MFSILQFIPLSLAGGTFHMEHALNIYLFYFGILCLRYKFHVTISSYLLCSYLLVRLTITRPFCRT